MFSHAHHQRALTSKDIKMQRKVANIAGLQLADLIAHPVKLVCLAERGLIPKPREAFGQTVFETVAGKFNINEWSGKVEGYGRILL